MRDVGMMACLFMATAGMVLGGFSMMAGRMFMVLSRFCVVFCTLYTHRRGVGLIFKQTLHTELTATTAGCQTIEGV
jgi:hypothetical protein